MLVSQSRFSLQSIVALHQTQLYFSARAEQESLSAAIAVHLYIITCGRKYFIKNGFATRILCITVNVIWIIKLTVFIPNHGNWRGYIRQM